jgi:hypothetical protein
VTENDSDACEYHPEEMERDEDFFCDHDNWDSDFDREEFPDGYIYGCCNKRGDEEGCKVSRHKEK